MTNFQLAILLSNLWMLAKPGRPSWHYDVAVFIWLVGAFAIKLTE